MTNAFLYRTSVIVGCAGSGKTTVVSKIVRIAKENGKSVVVLAPSAKASLRAADEIRRQAGEECANYTIHRFAKILPEDADAGETGDYLPVVQEPVPDFVIIPHIAIAEEYLDFYVRVTDKEEFFSMMKDVKRYGIEPKTSIGFGQIASIHVAEEKEHGDRCFRTDDGFPTSPLPVSDFEDEINHDAATGWSAYHASYWSSIGKTKCYLPRPEQYARLAVPDGVFKDLVAEIG